MLGAKMLRDAEGSNQVVHRIEAVKPPERQAGISLMSLRVYPIKKSGLIRSPAPAPSRPSPNADLSPALHQRQQTLRRGRL